MNKKHIFTLVVICSAIIGGVFFGTKTNAQVWEIENYPTNNTGLTCTRSNTTTNSMCGLYFNLASPLFMDYFDIDVGTTDVTATTTARLVIYDVESETDDLDDLTPVAISDTDTVGDLTSGGSWQFTFPYTYLTNDTYVALVELVDYESPPVNTPQLIFSGNTVLDDLYDMNRYKEVLEYHSGNGNMNPRFKIGQNIEAAKVTITYPTDQSTVSDFNITEYGTCTEGFDITIAPYNSTSTPIVAQSNACIDNAWSYYLGALEQGYYWTYASSTDFELEEVWFFLAQSLEDPEFLNNPLAGEEGGEESYWSFLQDWAADRLNFRPYSYVPEVVLNVYSAIDNASSTNWIEDVTVQTPTGDIQLPGITEDLFDDIDANFKTDVRNISTFVLYAAFIFFIWKIAHKFI